MHRWAPAGMALMVVAVSLGTCAGWAFAAAAVSGTVAAPAASAATHPPTTPGVTGSSSLVIEPTTEARLTDDFNPFSTTTPLGQMGVPSYIYEPLVQYNELQVNQYYPWLAQSWAFSTSGQTITFNLRPGVRWDDGSTLSATDVAYTFNLLKDNPTINDGIPIVSAVATNPTTFTLTLSQAGYSYLYNIARVPIVKNGYAAGANPRTAVDNNPDGTGPYALRSADDATRSRVVLTARDDYWQQGEPTIDELVFPAYRDRAAVQTALRAGTLDWASSFMPDVEADYVDKDQADNHYWFPPVNCISLDVNLTRYPTDRLVVRLAISAAIDRTSLSRQTEGGYDPPATSSSGLVLPTDSQFLTPVDTDDIQSGADEAATAQLMESAGYHMGLGGYWANASGQAVELSITDPIDTALSAGATVIAQQLRSAGFDASADAVTAGRWLKDLSNGAFDSSIVAGAAGPAPYYMYQNWLDPALVVHGHADGGNYERLDTATVGPVAAVVSRELADYAGSPAGSAGAGSAIEALANVVSEQLPVIPLMYGVAWAEFSTRHANGWPDSQDPYEPALPDAPFAEYTVLQLSTSST